MASSYARFINALGCERSTAKFPDLFASRATARGRIISVSPQSPEGKRIAGSSVSIWVPSTVRTIDCSALDARCKLLCFPRRSNQRKLIHGTVPSFQSLVTTASEHRRAATTEPLLREKKPEDAQDYLHRDSRSLSVPHLIPNFETRYSGRRRIRRFVRRM